MKIKYTFFVAIGLAIASSGALAQSALVEVDKNAVVQAIAGVQDVGNEDSINYLSSSGSSIVYDESFIQYTSYPSGTPQHDNWQNFQLALAGVIVYSVTLSGSADPTGVSCTDPIIAQQLADALADGDMYSDTSALNCDGRLWRVGGCNGKEINANGSICVCNVGYVVRGTIRNSNWGGMGTSTCGASSQTLRVEFVTNQRSVCIAPLGTNGADSCYQFRTQNWCNLQEGTWYPGLSCKADFPTIPLLVTIDSFSATRNNNGKVKIELVTGSETETAALHIYRAPAILQNLQQIQKVCQWDGIGTEVSGSVYSCKDKNAPVNVVYWPGEVEYSGTTNDYLKFMTYVQ